MASRLDRFRVAQDSEESGFEAALQELRAGGKRGHWIWYVFPQLAGLGTSALAQTYAIADPAEAVDYLHDPVLRSRLVAITDVVATHLTAARPTPIVTLMGSEIDARKLVSSLTLFGDVARRLHAHEGLDDCLALADRAEQVLNTAESEGYPPCEYTRRRLTGRG